MGFLHCHGQTSERHISRVMWAGLIRTVASVHMCCEVNFRVCGVQMLFWVYMVLTYVRMIVYVTTVTPSDPIDGKTVLNLHMYTFKASVYIDNKF